ncbi:hypothetical protein [Pelodictyon luteolum]|uniref:Uncharacterized protein n=1 Tax=Chlorobium luteolum (strain DSM 273 / BCRC 81028 / 2530) TaxID=319225 RepID=Q3B4P6_CHLL3|nr:hypothetical protein [Pelodictyon luteolum]ABB23685.1 hypothetical protein Plut_0816 [Pelodictyon luteolum DSM 273]
MHTMINNGVWGEELTTPLGENPTSSTTNNITSEKIRSCKNTVIELLYRGGEFIIYEATPWTHTIEVIGKNNPFRHRTRAGVMRAFDNWVKKNAASGTS